MTTAGSSWRARKAAYVRPHNSHDGCKCTARFLHTTSAGQVEASLLLQYNITFAGTDDTPRTIILSISPTNIESCKLALKSDGDLIPPLMLRFVPTTSVNDASDVLSLTITLKAPATVLYPRNMASFRPADSSDDADFEAFVRICQATSIRVHFAGAQFGFSGSQSSIECTNLRRFVGDLNTSPTASAPFDLTSADRGRGLQEGTWHVFRSSVTAPGIPSVLGKRRRQSSDLSPTPVSQKAIAHTTPPPYSPTEVNTPMEADASTPAVCVASSSKSCSFSPNDIRTTVFTAALPPYGQADECFCKDTRTSLLASMLMLVPKNVLQGALLQAGQAQHSPLSATRLEDAVASSSHKPEKGAQTGFQQLLTRHAEDHFKPLIHDMFTSEVESRLKRVVETALPRLTQEALARVVDPYYDQFYTDCQVAEMTMQEKVHENADEMKLKIDEGVEEVEACGRKYLAKITERGRRYLEQLENERLTFEQELEFEQDKLSRLIKSHELLPQQSSNAREGATATRRSSV